MKISTVEHVYEYNSRKRRSLDSSSRTLSPLCDTRCKNLPQTSKNKHSRGCRVCRGLALWSRSGWTRCDSCTRYNSHHKTLHSKQALTETDYLILRVMYAVIVVPENTTASTVATVAQDSSRGASTIGGITFAKGRMI